MLYTLLWNRPLCILSSYIFQTIKYLVLYLKYWLKCKNLAHNSGPTKFLNYYHWCKKKKKKKKKDPGTSSTTNHLNWPSNPGNIVKLEERLNAKQDFEKLGKNSDFPAIPWATIKS